MKIFPPHRPTSETRRTHARSQGFGPHLTLLTASLLLFGWAASGVGNAQSTELAFDDITMNGDEMVLTADNGYQIVVSGDATLNGDNGQVNLSAPGNFTLAAQGFTIQQIDFNNIEDMDDSGPRDSFIASVPGKWTDETDLRIAANSDGLEIFTLDPGVPVSWNSDSRDRLRVVPGVGDILINTSGGENPKREAASFRPVPTVERFTIYMDDIDGSRSAKMSFFLAPIPEEGVDPLTVEVVDDVPPRLSGPDGFGGTVTNSAMFASVQDGHATDQAAMTIAPNEPLESFTLSGPDADRFTLDEDGALRFNDPPAFAEPSDADGDNRYQVHVEAVDLGGNTTDVSATVVVDPPGGTSDTDATVPTVTADGPGDGAAGTYTHTEYSAEPIDRFQADEPVTWSLSGTDADLFEIDASGELRFTTERSHANPEDHDGDNTHDVTVIGTDASGNATPTSIQVDVVPRAPTLTGPDGPTRLTVGTEFAQTLPEENYVVVDGTRENGDASTFNPDNQFDPVKGRSYAGQITADMPIGGWQVVTGTDASAPDGHLFEVTSTGLVFFDPDGDASNEPPDYESPTDADADNVYEAVFQATDDAGDPLLDPSGTPVTARFTLTIQDLIEDVLPGSEATDAGYVDSDGDGVPDAIDPAPAEYDPQGFFYCEDDGRIVPGGGIVVTNSSGGSNTDVGTANDIRIVRDGSDGEFQWFAQIEDTFDVEYVPPPGTTIVTAENEGSLDVTNLLPDNPAFIGSEEDGTTGVLVDFSPTANAYYDEFVIEAGDPHVFGNNVALTDCEITHAVTVVQDGRESPDEDDGHVVFEITANDPAAADQRFEYALSGTSEPGVDLVADATGTVVLPAGETSVRISLPVVDDELIEEEETVVLDLLRYTEDEVTTPFAPPLTATATVQDGDTDEPDVEPDVAPDLTVVQDGRESPDEDDGHVVFEMTVDGPAPADRVFEYALGGTSEPGADVLAEATGTVVLPAGETSVRISLPVVDDERIEGDETVVLDLLRYTEDGVTTPITPTVSATATVRDDDAAGVRVTPHDLHAMEGQDDHGQLGLRLEGVPTHDVVITLAGDDQCDVRPTTVVFTPDAFADERLVDVVAVRDGAPEGPHACQPTATVTSEDPRYDALDVDLPGVEVSDALVDRIRDPLADLLHERLRVATEQQNDFLSGMARDARQALDRADGDPSHACRSTLARQAVARPVVFQPDSDAIASPSDATIEAWSETLLRCPALDVEVAGVTQDADAAQAEREQARSRAETVLRALVANGVAPERLRAGVHPGTVSGEQGGSPHVTLLAVTKGDAPMDGDHDVCRRSPEVGWDGYAEGGSEPWSAEADGSAVHYDCRTGIERSMSGRFSASHLVDFGHQRTLEATVRWEAWPSMDELRGVAADLRASRSAVTERAEGTMAGMGVHAGVYGARRFDLGLHLDYFAFAGVHRTTFDVQFLPSGDPVAVTGDHGSASLHGGVAASNTIRVGRWSLTPRAGLSVSRAMAADADVVATQTPWNEAGTVEIPDVSLLRGFAEPILVYEPSAGNAGERDEGPRQRFELAPHVRCDGALWGEDVVCGYGADVTYERRSTKGEDGLGVTVSYDRNEALTRTSLELHHHASVQGERGTLETRLEASADGAARVSTTLDWPF